MEIVIVPCNYVHDDFEYESAEDIPDECVEDLQAQKDYLGAIDFIVYTSNDEF